MHAVVFTFASNSACEGDYCSPGLSAGQFCVLWLHGVSRLGPIIISSHSPAIVVAALFCVYLVVIALLHPLKSAL
jgi:hypothetical protein